jgi:hypothetical protein
MFVIQGLNGQNINDAVKDVWNIEKESWKPEMATNKDCIKKRLEIFSDGLWRLYSDKGNVTAYMYFIRLASEKVSKYYSWFDYTENGQCINHIDPGKILFAVSIGSISKGSGNYLFKKGMGNIDKGLCYKGIEKIYACSRIPTLHKYFTNNDEVSIKLNDPLFQKDPVVEMLSSCGFKPYELCKNGFSVDQESLGFSLTMIKFMVN